MSIKTSCLFFFSERSFCYPAPVCKSLLLTAAGNGHLCQTSSFLTFLHKPCEETQGTGSIHVWCSAVKKQPVSPLCELYLKETLNTAVCFCNNTVNKQWSLNCGTSWIVRKILQYKVKKQRHGCFFFLCNTCQEICSWAAGRTVNDIQFCIFIYVMTNNYGMLDTVLWKGIYTSKVNRNFIFWRWNTEKSSGL